jgi:RimJ/RimL family protein N-acetyltransferase
LSELGIRTLTAADADAVHRLLSSDPEAYRRHFEGIPLDTAAIAAVLADARSDGYWGIESGGQLAALVLARGLDAGYAAPAFGVYVGERWSQRGLAALALEFVEVWARLNDRSELVLTVHPENAVARGMYERRGFLFSGELSPRGHRIYRKALGGDG